MEQYLNKIICGDCLEVMRGMPDKCVDLVVTSPPYDNIRDYKGYTFDFEGIAQQLTRILKDGGVIVWVVGDATVNGSETGTSFRQALYFKDVCGLNLHDTMIYNKNACAFPESNRYYQSFEYMFVFSNNFPRVVNLLKDRKNKYEGSGGVSSERQANGTLKKTKVTKCPKYGVRFNIWEIAQGYMKTTIDKEAYIHSAMFPEKLAKDHIISWSDPGDIVLDPFSGSGTTAKMAKQTDRQFIGIELSPEYCKIAEKRLAKTYYNEELF